MKFAESQAAVVDRETEPGKPASPSQSEILAQLERLVGSPHFRNSKRYPALLRFVVEETLAGRTASLKERTLGIEVFGRPVDYDTNADPVVRFTAGEIRKRIAQYYLAPGHEHELRFDLPLGSYVPHFAPATAEEHGAHVPMDSHRAVPFTTPEPEAEQAPLPGDGQSKTLVPKPLASSPAKRSRKLWTFLSVIAAALLLVAAPLTGLHLFRVHQQKVPLATVWGPLLLSKEPALIVLGVHSIDARGKDVSPGSDTRVPSTQQSMLSSMIRSEMVPVSDVISYGNITSLLARYRRVFRTQSAAETTFQQLRTGPIILIGGFDNQWTMRLTANLPYRLSADSESVHAITDAKHPLVSWKFDSAQSALNNSSDFAIVSGFYDPQIEQHILAVAGIGKSGTEAAAEFVTTSNQIRTWLATVPQPLGENFEIVLSTEVIEGQHGPPHVLASCSW